MDESTLETVESGTETPDASTETSTAEATPLEQTSTEQPDQPATVTATVPMSQRAPRSTQKRNHRGGLPKRHNWKADGKTLGYATMSGGNRSTCN